ncbi:MAG: ATP-binding cassette domain-containing protein [Verrucomicrobiales bacterium]|nr:ATP-binding cassette domain-containing protein [Verrucomicrobiales bacterium]
MSETLIEAQGVSKKYCRSLKRSLWYGLQDMATEALGSRGRHDQLRPEEFWAVNEVSFSLRRGECLALIGHNGAGKTTLLKMLNGLIKPDKGRITMRGRVGALIALGAGFNPILTGRENIYVNGSVLGFSQTDIDAKVEEIIEFAGIREFIDTPVRNYSSGMSVRLGFAIASAMEPDILLLDEVLAVGDVAFRFKCANRVRSIMKRAAVVFVSHSMEAISQICTTGLIMNRGCVAAQGAVSDVIAEYYRQAASTSAGPCGELVQSDSVSDIRLDIAPSLSQGGALKVALSIHCRRPFDKVHLAVNFLSQEMVPVACFSTRNGGHPLHLVPGSNQVEIATGPVRLRPGMYRLDVAFLDTQENHYLLRSYGQLPLQVHGEASGFAPYVVEVPASS